MKRDKPPYTKGFVKSADGTQIGYRQLGSGPGLILLHGGVNAAQHLCGSLPHWRTTTRFMFPTAAAAVPVGRSAPTTAFAKRTKISQDEDLAALVAHTGATSVFGTADGALFALHGALNLPMIEKVAAYAAHHRS